MATSKKFSISVLIGGKSTLGKLFGSSARQTEKFVGRVAKLGAGLAKVAGYATAAAGAVGAIGAKLFSDYLDRAGELKDFAAQIGMSAEALQSWGYAAEQAGVEGGAFNAALGQMTKQMGAAGRKTGTLYSLLSKGGKHDKAFLAQLTGAGSPEEQLDLLIRAMEGIPNPQKRAQLAMAAFGKSGAKMARLAAEGSEGLAKLRQEAADLGIVMSQEDVEAAEAFGDTLAKLKMGARGVANEVFRQLVPGLDDTAGGMTEWFKANRKVLGQKIADFVRGVGTALVDVYDWVQTNGPGIWSWVEKGVGFIGELVTGAGNFVDSVGGWGPALSIAAVGIGAMLGPVGLIAAGVGVILAYWQDIKGWIDRATDSALDYLGVVNPRDEMARRAALTAKKTIGEVSGDVYRERLADAKRIYGPTGTGEIGPRIPGAKADLEYAVLAARKLYEGGGQYQTGNALDSYYEQARHLFTGQDVSGPVAALERFAAALGTSKAEVVVRFEGVPQGFQLEPPRSKGPLRLTTKTGRRMVGAPAGSF